MGASKNRGLQSLAAAAAVGLIVAMNAAPAEAAALPMTLSSVTGPSGGGNSLTGTVTASAANPSPFPAGTVPTVQFQFNGVGATACSATAKPVTPIAATGAATTAGVVTVPPDNVLRMLGTKIGFQVPSSAYPVLDDQGDPSTVNDTGLVLKGTQTTSKWNVCVYDSPATVGSLLLASATYTLAVRPKITSIIPASSPASGNQLITVGGSGFSTAANATTATVGGVALTGIKVAANGNSFTAITPPRTPGTGLSLIVTTPGGPVNSNDPDNNGVADDNDPQTPGDVPILFSYTNGIVIAPNTAAANTKVDIDVKGLGFQSLAFNKSDSAAPTDATAHVFLVKDAYTPDSNRGVQECKRVLVVSNVELMCSLDLTATKLSITDSSAATGLVPEGTYTLTVVANGAVAADTPANPTIVSSGSTFTVAPY
jgi:IPT/TIG domain-containing protein